MGKYIHNANQRIHLIQMYGDHSQLLTLQSQQRAEISGYKRFALDLRVRKTQLKPRHVKVNAGKSLYLPGELFSNF